MGMIIGRSLAPLNSSRTLRAGRRRETSHLSDHNSCGKVQNVRRDSSAIDLLTSQRSLGYTYAVAKGRTGAPARTDVLQGTLDLMVLKTLDSMGPQHGYGIARRIEQVSDAVLTLNEGTVYASLMRLVQKGWIS